MAPATAGHGLGAKGSAEPSHLTSPLRSDHEECGSPEGVARQERRLVEKCTQLQNIEEGVRMEKPCPCPGPEPVMTQALDKDSGNLDFIPALTLDKFLHLHFPASTPKCHLPSLHCLWNSSGQQLALATLLCNIAHNWILVLSQVCWCESNEKKKKKRCKHFKICKNIQRQATAESSNEP